MFFHQRDTKPHRIAAHGSLTYSQAIFPVQIYYKATGVINWGDAWWSKMKIKTDIMSMFEWLMMVYICISIILATIYDSINDIRTPITL